jgi:hypothetical protein
MKSCSECQRELAACAGYGAPSSPEIVEHLSECNDCRATLQRLQVTALVHVHASMNLPKPALRPNLKPLASTVARGADRIPAQRMFRTFALKPLAVCAVALFALLIGTFLLRSLRPAHNTPAISSFTSIPVEPAPATVPADGATWRNLRSELYSTADVSADRPYKSAASLAIHYRVKDSHLETN